MIPSSSLIALFNSKCFFCVYVLLVTPRNYEEKVTATLVCTCRIPKHSIMIYDWVAHCQSQTEPPNSSSHIFFQSKLGVTQTIARQLPLAACTGKVGNMILKQTLRAANDPVSTFWKWHGLEAIFSSVLVVPCSLLFSLMLRTCLEKDKQGWFFPKALILGWAENQSWGRQFGQCPFQTSCVLPTLAQQDLVAKCCKHIQLSTLLVRWRYWNRCH